LVAVALVEMVLMVGHIMQQVEVVLVDLEQGPLQLVLFLVHIQL
jgi:hypothetical protein